MADTQTEGLISFGGLASGLDTDKIVGAMVNAAKTPLKQMERQRDVLDIHQAHLERAKSLASDLEASAHAMASTSRFIPYEAESSLPEVVGVAAGSGAQSGHLELSVERLAESFLGRSAAIDSETTSGLLQAGKVKWREGETPFEVDVGADWTLSQLALAINSQSGGLTASTIFDGKDFSLRLAGQQTGAAEAIVFDQDPTGLRLDQPENTLRQARDASVLIDGQTRIARPSNTLNNVVSGLTLQLKRPGGPAHIDVRPDIDVMKEHVVGFVTTYNTLLAGIVEMTVADKEQPAQLTGDTTLRGLVRGLQDIMSRPISGQNATYRSLESIGLATSKDGTLTLNEGKLTRALRTQHQDVARLFGRDYVRDTHGVADQIETHLKKYVAASQGIFANKTQSIDRQKNVLVRRQGQLEHHVEKYEAGIKSRFTDLEQRMSRLKSQNSFLSAQLEANQNKK